MGKRSNSEETSGVKKGPWLPEEDGKLIAYIKKNGHGSWSTLPQHAGLNRCGKSCRLRWTNYLRPDIKRGMFSYHEEVTIIHLHSLLGNKWSAIASHLPGRTDNEIKNFWNTRLRKKLMRMGIDPVTHKPRSDQNIILSDLHHHHHPHFFVDGIAPPASSSGSHLQNIAEFQLLRDVVMGFMTTNNHNHNNALTGERGNDECEGGDGGYGDGLPFVFEGGEEEGYGRVLGGGGFEAAPTVDYSDSEGWRRGSCGDEDCSYDCEIFDAWREF